MVINVTEETEDVNFVTKNILVKTFSSKSVPEHSAKVRNRDTLRHKIPFQMFDL